jgi:hypothetical protein
VSASPITSKAGVEVIPGSLRARLQRHCGQVQAECLQHRAGDRFRTTTHGQKRESSAGTNGSLPRQRLTTQTYYRYCLWRRSSDIAYAVQRIHARNRHENNQLECICTNQRTWEFRDKNADGHRSPTERTGWCRADLTLSIYVTLRQFASLIHIRTPTRDRLLRKDSALTNAHRERFALRSFAAPMDTKRTLRLILASFLECAILATA